MDLLYVLLILLTVTRFFGEIAERLGQPLILGELIAGIALGLLANNFSETFPTLSHLPHDEVFIGITDLAVFFLMLLAGLELHPRQMARGSGSTIFIALGGMLLPLACGFALAWWFLPDSPFHLAQALFLGTSLAITAVPVSVKVMSDLHQLDSRVGQTIISAAQPGDPRHPYRADRNRFDSRRYVHRDDLRQGRDFLRPCLRDRFLCTADLRPHAQAHDRHRT